MPVTGQMTTIEDFEGTPLFVGYGGGQGASVIDDNPIQGIRHGGRRVDNTTNKGFGVSFGAISLAAPGVHIRTWLNIAQWGSVTKVQHRISSGVDDDHELPPAEFPALGGYIPLWTDVSRTPESGGSANEGSISEIGVLIDIGDVGGNAPNLQEDLISYGTIAGIWTGSGGTVQDFLDFEVSTRAGALVNTFSGVAIFFRIQIGNASIASDFTLDQLLTAPDQALVAADAVGVTVNLENAASSFIGPAGGGVKAKDTANQVTRPDFIVMGNAGTAVIEPGFILEGLRTIELTDAVTVSAGAVLDAVNITQNGAIFNGPTIRARSASGVATIADADLSAMSEVTFAQAGSGHMLELTAAGNYVIDGLRGLDQSGGFGGTGTNDAAVYISATTGTVTFDIINGGSAPTYRTDGAEVVINNSVPVKVTVVSTADGSPAIANPSVFLEAAPGGQMLSEVSGSITANGSVATATVANHGLSTGEKVAVRGCDNLDGINGLKSVSVVDTNTFTYPTTVNGTAAGSVNVTAVIIGEVGPSSGVVTRSLGYTGDQPVRGWVRKASSDPRFKQGPIAGTITGSGFDTTISLIPEQ